MASDLKRKREDQLSDDDDVELDAETAKKHKLPTGEELRTLKDAAGLYQSSSFKLQIDALLPNVRPKESRTAPLDQFLFTLRSHLLSLPHIKPQHPLVAARTLSESGVAVPFALPHPTQDTKWTVAFEPPSNIHVVGSWANKISVKKKDGKYFGLDLSIEMPASLFQEKDYLDARYFHKRAYYLAVVAQSISTSFEVDVFYGATLNDPRQTFIVLRPRKGASHDFSKTHAEIHIIPALSSSHPIPLHRLSPSHSNVRVQPPTDALLPMTNSSTPIYNTAILISTFPKLSLLSTNTLIQSSPTFRDAHTLLRVWANQRGYGEGALCIHGFEGKGSWWASVLGLLLDGEEPVSVVGKWNASKKRSVGKGLSSYQLFRASLDLLAKQDFENAPAFVKSANGHRYSPEEYPSNHSAVFVDATSTINHLVDVPFTSLDMLQYDAQKTLEQLNDSTGTDDVFADVFLRDQTHLSKRCDAVIRVDLSRVSKYRSTFEFVEYGTSDNALLAAISRFLRRGLGDRVRALAIFHPSSNVRSISEMSRPARMSVIHIGLIYSPEDAFRLVDHGPAAGEQDTEAAKEFRQLWGPKSELRRFKDGRITESVVWEVKTSDERAHIPAFIVRHLLHLHFGVPIADIKTIATPFDVKLRLPDHLASLLQHVGATGGFKAALTAFDGLVKNFKALDEKLPLALLNVSPVAEYLRYTSTFTPVPISLSSSLALPTPLRYLPHIPIILEFEKSSKWPDDLRAIQKIKLAFFETIASALMTASPGLRAAVHIEYSCDSDIQDHASLEILTPEGWAFSARIWHDREAVLLERLASPAQTPVTPSPQPSKDQRMARRALDIYTRRFIHAPRHHRAIATVAHRYIAYPGTVRLVKRWLASHWLLGVHVSEEVVEIICARSFVGNGVALPDTATNAPRSKERGFALVIEFLKEWKPENPIFVPLYEDNGPSIEPSVVAVSSKEGVWTISTSEDPRGKMWTSSGPDIVAAQRLCALAKEAHKVLQENDVDPLSVKRLFAHAIDDYDIVIDLDPTVLPRYHQNIDADELVWSKSGVGRPTDGDAVSRPGFDPARILFDDLQSTYSDTLKFFFDIYGGHRIGAIWLLNVSRTRPFRALGGFSSVPATEGGKSKEKDKRDAVLLNRQSVLDEIKRLGTGLIKKITVREK
ncbi:Nrap protein [Boletus edulis BED1]|uniref:U3 small nucleolar RNA-associated protein 22 n=1 Tax=Boletus edulis BED1 TaxID=1328754 RepID=A0AAD4GGI9_BOLED|nr:Nrap protein [Boletus edulis BED1]